MKKVIFLLLALPYATSLLAARDDNHIIVEDIVNLRAEANTNSAVLLKLASGRIVVEIEAHDDWLKVSTGRSDIPEGWIHKSLLEKKQSASLPKIETSFDLFKLAFGEFHQRLRTDTPLVFFSAVNDMGNGDLQVISTPSWLYRLESDRLQDMESIFAIWQAVQGDEITLSVSIVDQNEDLLLFTLK